MLFCSITLTPFVFCPPPPPPPQYVFELVEATLELFNDQDPNVRYHAVEALYNIAKVARGLLLVKFAEIFKGMCALKLDNDRQVQYTPSPTLLQFPLHIFFVPFTTNS